jgi:threonine aldolase
LALDIRKYRALCTRALVGHGLRDAAALLAEIPTEPTVIDTYGEHGAVEALESEMRAALGKPAVAFMPSGTMAQQIALRIHADRRNRRAVAFHPTCHLEIHEDKAYQRLHGLIGVTVGASRSLITLEDLKRVPEPLAAVLFELPQREIGGRLPAWADLEAQVAYVRSRGAAVHLDGARLWESTPFYQRTPAEICALFDTVYVSHYKGLGALAGCCLAGPGEDIAEARAWRKRHGGTLYGMWPNAASALANLRKRLPLMPRYYEHALAIAQALQGVPNVQVVPEPPQTPMMLLHLRVDADAFRARAWKLAEDEGLATWPTATPGPLGTQVLELAVGDATLAFTPEEVAGIVRRLVN